MVVTAKQAMMKYICLLMGMALFAVSRPVHAQSYTITSLEGAPVKVKLSRGKGWRQLFISIPADSIVLDDCDEIKAITVLKSKFLEINYLGRGGTGFTGGSVLVLSVNKHKLNVALVVDAFASSFAPGYDEIPYNEKYYKATFALTGTDNSNYKMHLKVTERLTSKPRSSDDYDRYSQPTLSFDPKLNVFYTAIKPIDHVFKLENTINIYIKGILPTIALAGENYYYFEKQWYKQGIDNTLFTEY